MEQVFYTCYNLSDSYNGLDSKTLDSIERIMYLSLINKTSNPRVNEGAAGELTVMSLFSPNVSFMCN